MTRWLVRLWSSKSKRSHRRPRAVRLRLDRLEDRVAPAVITVTSTGDTIAIDGLATLREAITSINNQADINGDVTLNRVGGYASTPGGTPDVINFDIPAAGVQTISATSAEPTVVRPLTINGYAQAGASANTLANADNAVILIQLDGASAGAGVDGLTLGAGSGGSTIKGLDITNFSGNGLVAASNGNTIVGNFIGVNAAGTTRMPNGTFPNSGDGIRIQNASNNQIGSTNPADRNIASGNSVDGIHVEGTLAAPASGNIIQGNFVGLAADGKSSVGNRTEPAPAPGTAEGNNLFGIEISGGNLNTLGGTAAGARNVVAFNADGIEVDNGGQQNIIQGNFVGVAADGVTPAGNLLHGIALRSSNGFTSPLGPAQPNEPGVSFNLIGGTAVGAGNLVEFNGTGGIAVFGNPVSASGQPNIGNAIEGNSLFENGRSNPTALVGIDLSNSFLYPKDDGITANDSKGHGAPNDPNNFQNFPVLTSVGESAGKTTITGTLKSTPNSTFRIEFFANDADPLAGIAEGQQFLGSVSTTTDITGNASFSATFKVAVANGRIVTATATDAIGNTSEFSAGLTLTLVPDSNLFPIGFGAGTNGAEAVVNLKANGQVVATPTPFPGFTGEIHSALGDINGDGTPDPIWAAGSGGGPRVEVIDGKTGATLANFFAFDPKFTGGVFVAVGDVNDDHVPDLIVGAGPGGGPHVKVIDGTKLNQLQPNGEIADSALLASFFAFDPKFTGGVGVAAGDFNGDFTADVVAAAGPGGGPAVEVVDGLKATQVQANGQIANSALLASFFAYAPAFTGGVFVAAGDFNGDKVPDIITGPGAGGGPQVKVIDGAKLGGVQANGEIADSSLLASFFAYEAGFTGGVRVGAVDVNGDGLADIVTGAGPGSRPHVEVFRAQDLALLDSFFAQAASFTGGVFVASSAAPLAPPIDPLASTINDLYVFRSPANANNTVLIMDFEPFPGAVAPNFADPRLTYTIHIDNNGDAADDVTLQVTYRAPDNNGVQSVTLTGSSTSDPALNGVLATGKTGTTAPLGQNIPILGGGTFRSGIHDEPFFFDKGAFDNLVAAGDTSKFPRPPGVAHNFFGPNGNTFSIILEIPSADIPSPANNPNNIIGVWSTISENGVQLSRMGRPLIDDALIPPVPRNNLSRGDRRAVFETSSPSNDRTNFRDDMISVLTNPTFIYKRTSADASFLADALLPDELMFQIGNPNGFGTTIGPGPGFFTGPFPGGQVLGNGRRFADDVVDIDFNILTNGAIPGDNVGDDNGLKVTDGSVDPVSGQTRAIAFPYIGLANLPLNGPGTFPNP